MDNLIQTEHQQRSCHLFSISNLTCCKFVALKENTLSHSFQNYYCNQTKHTPQSVFNGLSEFATKGGTGEGSEPPHQKNEPSPFPSCITPSLPWLQTTYWEKVSLISFRQNLLFFACGAHFQCRNHDLFEIVLCPQYKIMSSRIISLNYTYCIPHLTKNVPSDIILLLAPTMYELPYPFPQACRLEETLQLWGESRSAAKKMLISHTRKIPLTKQQFSCNHSIQASFISIVIVVVSFF